MNVADKPLSKHCCSVAAFVNDLIDEGIVGAVANDCWNYCYGDDGSAAVIAVGDVENAFDM